MSSILFGIATATVILVGRRFHRLFPGVLVAVVGAIAVSLEIGYQESTIGELDGGFITLETHFWWSRTGDLLLPAAAIALMGFAEPATIARTFAAKDRLLWNANREMFSQGVANVVAAVSGAFPVGGSFSRSALNRMAGATSPWAGAITGDPFVVAATNSSSRSDRDSRRG